MELPRNALDPQKAYLDPLFLAREQLRAGKNVKDFAEVLQIDYRTLRDILAGRGVLFSTAKAVADKFDEDVVSLLAPWDPRYEPPRNNSGPWSPFTDWEAKRLLEQGRLAPNGLLYIVCGMEHRHTTGKRGRGKFYHLFWLRSELRDDARHQLHRHADVCARVGLHPHVAVNLTSTPTANQEGWWVIDDWIGETTLADQLRSGPWPRDQLPRLLLEIARGLDALHKAQVVFRELAPARVLISDKDGRAVLTDFELAKLVDGSPSVSGDWPEDPFRAPEVDGGVTTVRADLYSFALVAGVALVGPQFDPGQVVDILGAAGMPKRLQRLMVDCSEPVPDRRPPDLSALLKELTRWAEK